VLDTTTSRGRARSAPPVTASWRSGTSPSRTVPNPPASRIPRQTTKRTISTRKPSVAATLRSYRQPTIARTANTRPQKGETMRYVSTVKCCVIVLGLVTVGGISESLADCHVTTFVKLRNGACGRPTRWELNAGTPVRLTGARGYCRDPGWPNRHWAEVEDPGYHARFDPGYVAEAVLSFRCYRHPRGHRQTPV